jgi:hypothetical protein
MISSLPLRPPCQIGVARSARNAAGHYRRSKAGQSPRSCATMTQIPVRVQNEDLALSYLPTTDLAPHLAGPGIKRPVHRFERPLHRIKTSDVHLEHRAAPEGPVERCRLPFSRSAETA